MGFFCHAVIFLFVLLSCHVLYSDQAIFPTTQPPPLQEEFPEKCYKDLGCFNTSEPYYHPTLRPVVLLPFNLEQISTKFLLYTQKNPTEPQFIHYSDESIADSSYGGKNPTKIFIPGYAVKYSENDVYETLKNEILKSGNYNVIMVDWSDSNQPPYLQAIANGRVVGAQIALLVEELQGFYRVPLHKFHLIGHSLGASVAGWAGEKIENEGTIEIIDTNIDPSLIGEKEKITIKVGRITGLDPSSVFFESAPRAVRLDTSDASLVDVIITNGGTTFEEGYATLEPIGHVNFYVNGGRLQPGCYNSTEDLKDFNVLRNLCSHMRSVYLFAASINQCLFMGTACENYESFLAGKCTRHYTGSLRNGVFLKSEMGFHSKGLRHPFERKFYLNTTAEPPFCIETRSVAGSDPTNAAESDPENAARILSYEGLNLFFLIGLTLSLRYLNVKASY